MAKKDEGLRLLTEILKSIDLVGIDGTLANLKRSIKPFTDCQQESIQFIIAKVCTYFNVPQKELFLGTSRGQRVHARNACIWLLRHKVKLKYSDIDEVFLEKLSYPLIAQCINKVSFLDPNMKEEKMVLDIVKLIDHDFTEFKKEQNNKNPKQ